MRFSYLFEVSLLVVLACSFFWGSVTATPSDCVTSLVEYKPTTEDIQFLEWAKRFDKTYETKDLPRYFETWKNNLRYIEESNADKNKSYRLEMNKFGDLTTEEFGNMIAGYKPYLKQNNPMDHDLASKNNEIMMEADRKVGGGMGVGGDNAVNGGDNGLNGVDNGLNGVDNGVNWVKAGKVTQIEDQGSCGGCWSFSAAGAIEGVNAIAGRALIRLSKQQLIDCAGSAGNQGCNGGLMDSAFTWVARHGGMTSEAYYPYKAKQKICQWAPSYAKISGYADVPTRNETALLQALNGRPISIAVEADQKVWQFYHSGVLDDASCGTNLDHGVLLVGWDYDIIARKDYWLVKNSWGTNWGIGGYIKLVRNKNQCGIALSASYPIY